MDQSCFARLVRSGVPNIVLDAQGRTRKQISKLYSWRYKKLDDLPHVSTEERFQLANAGMAKVGSDYRLFFVRAGIVPTTALFPKRPRSRVSMLFVPVDALVRLSSAIDIDFNNLSRAKTSLARCLQSDASSRPAFGPPASISTVDKYQGQQNDIVLLSLVRTKHVGHLRDVRRLVVSLSRARLGVYVFGSKKIFEKRGRVEAGFENFDE